MAKVYIVTAGMYSDFHIMAAFSTETLAQEWIVRSKRDSTEIHIMEYDVDEPEEYGYVTIISMDRRGEVEHVRTRWQVKDKGKLRLSRRNSTEMVLFGAVDTGREELTPEAHLERATKVANEERTRLIAFGYW